MGAIRIGAVIAKKYRLEALLARGGMGSVWAARHVSLDRRLAVKFISPEVAGREDVRTRFDREARAAALLQSPNVVQIHDYGIDDDVPYLVMELLQGEDLGARLAERGRLPVADTVNLIRQVARALRRFGEAGIVHRDLKPSNLFIVRGEDDEDIVKVLDFGIAKAPRIGPGDATRTGVMIGSPRYMSPEQAQGSPLVDHRSDSWSLAVVTYRSLTGEMPFRGPDVAALVLNVCNETPPPPSHFDAALGPALDAFFVKALARPPDDRFQTAREFCAGLEDAAGQTPPAARSTSSLPPAARASVPTRSLTLSPAPPVPARSELLTRPEPSIERRPLVVEETPGSVDVPARDAPRVHARRPLPAVLGAVAMVAALSLLWSLTSPAGLRGTAPSSAVEATPAPSSPPSVEAPLFTCAELPSSPHPSPPRSSSVAPGAATKKRSPTRAHPILGF